MHSLIATFSDLEDPRHHRTRKHELLAILVIALLAVMCGANSWVEVATFARSREDWLRRYLPLPHGTASHDTFGRVFARLDPDEVQQRFWSWMARLLGRLTGQHLAVDGKALKGSHDGDQHGPVHLVNAWSVHQHLFFGQVKVDGKSNEITAIPELLAVLDITDCLVSIDAMGGQVAIAQLIRDKGGDYLLALKGNQPTMLAAAERAFEQIDAVQDFPQLAAAQLPPPAHDHDQTEEAGHNRDEVRRVWSMPVAETMRIWDEAERKEVARWPDLSTLVCVEAERTVVGKKRSLSKRYFLASRPLSAKAAGIAARGHWGVENGLHWRLDVLFGEDGSRVRKDHGPENLSLLKKIALNAIKADPSKGSVKVKRFKAAMDPDFLLQLLKAVERPKPKKKKPSPRSRASRSSNL